MIEVLSVEANVAEGGQFIYDVPIEPWMEERHGFFDHLVMVEDLSGHEPDWSTLQFQSLLDDEGEPLGFIESSGNLSHFAPVHASLIGAGEKGGGVRIKFRTRLARRIKITIVRALRSNVAKWLSCALCKRGLREILRFLFAVVGLPLPDIGDIEFANDLIDRLLDEIDSGVISDFLDDLGLGEGLKEGLKDVLDGVRKFSMALNELCRQICRTLGLCT
ncbi:MAG: hypothetical protein PVF65_05180 [Sphingomonadales bacterium]